MSPNQEHNAERPTVGSGKVPLWVKIMWVFGVSWVLFYVVMGLRHSPLDW